MKPDRGCHLVNTTQSAQCGLQSTRAKQRRGCSPVPIADHVWKHPPARSSHDIGSARHRYCKLVTLHLYRPSQQRFYYLQTAVKPTASPFKIVRAEKQRPPCPTSPCTRRNHHRCTHARQNVAAPQQTHRRAAFQSHGKYSSSNYPPAGTKTLVNVTLECTRLAFVICACSSTAARRAHPQSWQSHSMPEGAQFPGHQHSYTRPQR